jgi:hypothetical protein
MSAHRISATAGSLSHGLMKTPTAQLGINGGSQPEEKRRAGGHGPTLADQIEHSLMANLPTPTARPGDSSSRGPDPARYRGPKSLGGRRSNLDDAVAAIEDRSPWLGDLLPVPGVQADGPEVPEVTSMLPTPLSGEARHGSPNQHRSAGDTMLTGEILALANPDRGLSPVRAGRLGQAEPPTLPTPNARDGKGRDLPTRGGGQGLPSAVLPTPVSHPTGRTPEQHMDARSRDGRTVPCDLGVAVSSLEASPAATGTGSAGPPGNGPLIPTPTAADGDRASLVYPRGNPTLAGTAVQFLPTPAAGAFNDGESPESWAARNERLRAKGYNGNGMGKPLTVVAQELLPTPRVTERAGMQPSPATVRGTHGRDLGPTVGGLLPTPSAADGLGGHINRSGPRAGELLLGGQARQIAESSGANSPPPSPGGSSSPDGPPQLPLTWDGPAPD